MCTGSFFKHVVNARHTVLDSTYNLFTATTISTGYTNGNLMMKFFTLVKKKGVETAILPLEVLKVRGHQTHY